MQNWSTEVVEIELVIDCYKYLLDDPSVLLLFNLVVGSQFVCPARRRFCVAEGKG